MRKGIAYFCHPLDHIQIESVPAQLVSERKEFDSEDSSSTLTAEGYLKKRLAETYGWGKQTASERD